MLYVMENSDNKVMAPDDHKKNLPFTGHLTGNQTSHGLTISTNDEMHWCPDMDYLACDNIYRTPKDIDNSQISFTLASNSNSFSNSPFMNNNFDIHLAQIDIETFKSEDIKNIRYNQSVNASTDDTLRIVDSISSFNSNHLQLPHEDGEEALSIDSLDISMDNEINSELIQKCTINDKTKYKIAMIDSSAHSQMHSSQNNFINPFNVSSNSINNNNNTSNNNNNNNDNTENNRSFDMNDSQTLQSPGTLLKMFFQNKINSNENSTGNLLADAKNNNDISGTFRMNEVNSFTTEGTIDESTGNSNSLNTIDSNELPLHVLDLSKKLRSLNLNKPLKYGSTSISSNTSYTSTTTSSSATTDKRKPKSSTNPFLNSCEQNKNTKSASTQFPDLFQDKQVQASFKESEFKEAPVLVYYPNYSLPDLSFLEEIFHKDSAEHPVYLSPVKHEPVKINCEHSVQLRAHNNNTKRKCRPKSYTDYESVLNQDLSHIKDWDSLNLLLPDDFKEFIEQNNLLNFNNQNNNSGNKEQLGKNANIPLPIKAMIPNNHRLFQNVKLRPHSKHSNSRTKRYSLQDHYLNQNNLNYYNYSSNSSNNNNNNNNPSGMIKDELNTFMIRSQTMPNCQLAFNVHGACHSHLPSAPAPRFHNCCHNCSCCHSGCHSPLINSSQTSPQKANFNWDLLSSSNSFKKLLSFLSKLDEYSSHSDIPDSVDKIDHQTENKTKRQTNQNSNQHNNSKQSKTSKHLSQASEMSNRSGKNGFNANYSTTSTNQNRTAQIQTKNSMEKTKIILKRPSSLNKNNANNNSSIPVPKRMSSMIPVLRNNSNPTSNTNTTQLKKQNFCQQQSTQQHSTHYSKGRKSGNTRF